MGPVRPVGRVRGKVRSETCAAPWPRVIDWLGHSLPTWQSSAVQAIQRRDRAPNWPEQRSSPTEKCVNSAQSWRQALSAQSWQDKLAFNGARARRCEAITHIGVCKWFDLFLIVYSSSCCGILLIWICILMWFGKLTRQFVGHCRCVWGVGVAITSSFTSRKWHFVIRSK